MGDSKDRPSWLSKLIDVYVTDFKDAENKMEDLYFLSKKTKGQ